MDNPADNQPVPAPTEAHVTGPPAATPEVQPVTPAAAPTPAPAPPEPPPKIFTAPSPGESITSLLTHNTYTMGQQIGEGSFGIVFDCIDGWNNQLAVKVLKPLKSFEEVQAAANSEVQKLFLLRHPFVTYVYDYFVYRDTFYIITERCDQSLEHLFTLSWFRGPTWLMPLARCLLQAVHLFTTRGSPIKISISGTCLSHTPEMR